jgi:hypothetical protein
MSVRVCLGSARLYRFIGADTDRGDLNLLDRHAFEVGKLLTQRVALGGRTADDAMGSRKLLHHHVQMAIERTK